MTKPKKHLDWYKDDKSYPVKKEYCAKCKYRTATEKNGNGHKCNYLWITGELKTPHHCVNKNGSCPYFEEGAMLRPDKKSATLFTKN